MSPFKRVLIGLDGTSTDRTILEHVAQIRQILQPHALYFVHIARNLDLPQKITEEYRESITPSDANIKDILKNEIEKQLTATNGFSYEVIVENGNPVEEILRVVQEKEIDLVVLGRKPKSVLGYISREIAHICPCSLIFLSDLLPERIERVVVPVDFSSYSRKALEGALYFKSMNPKLAVFPLHIYRVPSGYSKSGKPLEKLAEEIRDNAIRDWETFLSQVNSSALAEKCEFVMDGNDNPAGRIMEYGFRKKADLLVIGSRGRTLMASFLIGSVAAKIVQSTPYFSTLIYKDREENMSLLGAFLKT